MAAPSLTSNEQRDLDFNLENPDWVALKLVLRKIDEEIADHRKHLIRKVSNWFMGLEMFREYEVNREDHGPLIDRDLEFYRAALTNLMAQGESLLLSLRSHAEVDREKTGFSVSDVAANLEHLRMKYSMRFFQLGEARRSTILQEVFGEPV